VVAVLIHHQRSRKGIDTAALKNKTGFKGREMENIVYMPRKQGKIKSGPKGIYVKR